MKQFTILRIGERPSTISATAWTVVTLITIPAATASTSARFSSAYKREVVLDSWSADHIVSCRDVECRTSQRVLALNLYEIELEGS